MDEYDGYQPIHYCGCGCGMVIGDGDYASGKRLHTQLIPRQRRYTALPPPRTIPLASTRR